MSIAGYIFLIVVIVGLWLITGSYEWQPSKPVAGILRTINKRYGGNNPQNEAFSVYVKIETSNLTEADFEKKIWNIKKRDKGKKQNLEIILLGHEAVRINEEVQQKTKYRLENRFKGLTVKFE